MTALIVAGLAFSAWWYLFAPCDTIVHLSWSLKDVPVRCFGSLK